jgi:hypothetical protein
VKGVTSRLALKSSTSPDPFGAEKQPEDNFGPNWLVC